MRGVDYSPLPPLQPRQTDAERLRDLEWAIREIRALARPNGGWAFLALNSIRGVLDHV